MSAARSIIDVRGVTVRFDGFQALDALDFAVAHGELRFVIGPNGAGKTTLLDVLTGKTRPSSGAVTFDGQVDITRLSEHAIARRGVARKFQTPRVFGSLTVRENVEAAASLRDGLGRLLVSASGRARDDEAVDAIDATLELIGLRGRGDARAGTLAHGEKQWLEIGMLLAQDPKLLLLDEPVAGMTRGEREKTGELLRHIAQRRSVVVVEHDMDFVRRFARTVTVLHAGKLLCQGTAYEVQRDEKVIEVYLGRARDKAPDTRPRPAASEA